VLKRAAIALLKRATAHNHLLLIYSMLLVLDTALLEWVSEYAVWAYTTSDSAVS